VLSNPIAAVPSIVRARAGISLFLATVLLAAVLGFTGRRLKTEVAPGGILSFELAGTLSTARAIVRSWQPSLIPVVSLSLGLDFLFIPLYSTFGALIVFWVSDRLRGAYSILASGGVVLGWLMWVAALCDCGENICLLIGLQGEPVSPFPEAARVFSSIKFGLISAGFTFAILGMFAGKKGVGLHSATPSEAAGAA
jgi:hypothetical protein